MLTYSIDQGRGTDPRSVAARACSISRSRVEEWVMDIEAAIDRIKAVVGPRGWFADPGDREPYLVESRGLYRGATRLVVRPASTAEVAAVVAICAEAKLPIVPQ